jgi:2-oxoisovalerate dehydrogenase E1 component
MFQIVDPNGTVVGDVPALQDDEFVELYRLMALARTFDRKAVALQRQGRIGTFPPLEGQEATQIGSAFALAEDDFVFPSYREHGVQIARGMPLDIVMSYWRGLPNEHWDVRRYRMNMNTVPLATQLPHAVGHAYGTRQAGEQAVSIAYVGDGATSEGDFHAAMTFAGVWKTPNVFICSNNLWAISVPISKQSAAERLADKAVGYGIDGARVDGMDVLAMFDVTSRAVERARAGGGASLIEAMTYRYGPHATADDPRRYRSVDEEREWRERDPLIRYVSFLQARDLWSPEVDAQVEHEVDEQITKAIESVEAWQPPGRDVAIRHSYHRIPPTLVRQLHTAQDAEGEKRTQFEPHETWEIAHDRLPEGLTTQMNMAEAINAALQEGMSSSPQAVVLGEDVAQVGGVFRITEGLLDSFGEARVIDTPLSEVGIVGTAVGMAIAGLRPIAEIQFDGFVYPSFDQIVSHLGRMRARTRSNVELPIIVRWPNGGGIGAHEFHGDSPEAYFVHAPGLTVVVPSTATDAKGLLAAAMASHDPVLFLEPKILYRAAREPVPTEHYTLPIGRARIRRLGADVTIVTYGGMVPVSLAAAERAADDGIDVEVIDLRTLWPWDEETVLASVEKTGRLVLVQEPPRSAGMAAEVAATVAERAIYSLMSPIIRVTGFDAPWPQFAVESSAIVSSNQVLAGVRRAME